MINKQIILLLLLLGCAPFVRAQNVQTVSKSDIIENINGKDYYLHFVDKGETLFAIAAAYEVRVDDIFKENPLSRKGIHPGMVLKILVNQQAIEEGHINKPQNSSSFFYHIVQAQETYYGIAKKYNITVEQLKAMNPDAEPGLKEGQSLKVPALNKDDTVTLQHSENDIIHVVEAGENLYRIARKYDVTLGQIYNLNPELEENINIGDQIFIPAIDNKETGPAATPDIRKTQPNITHNVKAGETLYSIARDYALSLDSVYFYNPQLHGQPHLSIGQELNLPASKHSKFFILHKPSKNQSLDKISELYQVDYEKIVKMNPEITRKAKKGQTVKIPVEPLAQKETNKIPEASNEVEKPVPCDQSYNPAEKTFNVALMLPFYLEEMDSLSAREKEHISSLASFKPFRFMNFYAGFQMALDSMKSQGMQVNLFVYDVDNSEEKTNKVLHASELSGMDLIIGPLFGQSFSTIADFAKTYDIPIVNPFSQREEIIINNPWVYKIKPSFEFQNEQLIHYVIENFPNDNIILVRNNKYKYQSELSFIRNSLNRSRSGHIYLKNEDIIQLMRKSKDKPNSLLTENKLIKLSYLKDNIHDSTYVSNMIKEVNYVDDSAKGMQLNLSKIRPNIVIALSDDIVFSKDLLSQLNKLALDHEITLFGMPDWTRFSDLETNHLLNLNFHCFSSSIIDYENSNIKRWIQQYRNRYHTEPAPYNFAFDGFDVGWYFLNALYSFGSGFYSCTHSFEPSLVQNDFYFNQKPESGYQNIHWNIGYYKNHRIVRVKNKIINDRTSLNW